MLSRLTTRVLSWVSWGLPSRGKARGYELKRNFEHIRQQKDSSCRRHKLVRKTGVVREEGSGNSQQRKQTSQRSGNYPRGQKYIPGATRRLFKRWRTSPKRRGVGRERIHPDEGTRRCEHAYGTGTIVSENNNH